jgi:hypothetical protein
MCLLARRGWNGSIVSRLSPASTAQSSLVADLPVDHVQHLGVEDNLYVPRRSAASLGGVRPRGA